MLEFLDRTLDQLEKLKAEYTAEQDRTNQLVQQAEEEDRCARAKLHSVTKSISLLTDLRNELQLEGDQ